MGDKLGVKETTSAAVKPCRSAALQPVSPLGHSETVCVCICVCVCGCCVCCVSESDRVCVRMCVCVCSDLSCRCVRSRLCAKEQSSGRGVDLGRGNLSFHKL